MRVRFIRSLSFRQGRFRVGTVSPTALNIFNNIFLIFTDVLINIIEKILKQITDGSCQGGGKMKCVGDRMVYNLFQGDCIFCKDLFQGIFEAKKIQCSEFATLCGVIWGGKRREEFECI